AGTRCCAAGRGRRSRSSRGTRSATGTFRSAGRSSRASAVPPTAERLAAALADLPVVIEDLTCASGAIPVPSYGGPRPTSIVTLIGAGRRGEGEHVGWSAAAHSGFAR